MGWPRAWLLARGFRGFRSRRPLEEEVPQLSVNHHRPSLSLFPHFAEPPCALLRPSTVALLSAVTAAAPVAASRR
uniref:Uncharacterized protein n=1 Tax=Oryza meridionalis TaxID=40149 RepID=A0A0E0CQC9_9ORYZ